MSDLGSGAGKGGGGGGSIRDAGGAFGRMQHAREGQYFYKKQKEQLRQLRSQLNKSMEFHKEQIKIHEQAIEEHRRHIEELGEEDSHLKQDE